MLSRIIRPFNYNVCESEFHLNDINNCPRGHLCKLHYSGSVINPDWQCLAEQLLTDTDSSWLTVTILRWHHQLTVIECTQSQKISDTNSWQCFRYCKQSLPITTLSLTPTTDIDSHQLTLTVGNWHRQLTVPDCTQSHIDLVLTLLGDTADLPFEPEFPLL